MKCSEIMDVCRKLAPEDCACDWDNVGLLVGRRDREVRKIRIALDADDAVVRQAVEEGADMLLTHHPMIFKPLKKINDDDFISRRVLALAASDISYYAMHQFRRRARLHGRSGRRPPGICKPAGAGAYGRA